VLHVIYIHGLAASRAQARPRSAGRDEADAEPERDAAQLLVVVPDNLHVDRVGALRGSGKDLRTHQCA
jgi:hypothetical protein